MPSDQVDELVLLELVTRRSKEPNRPVRCITFGTASEIEEALSYDRSLPSFTPQTSPLEPTPTAPSNREANAGISSSKKNKKKSGKGGKGANNAAAPGSVSATKPAPPNASNGAKTEPAMSDADSDSLPPLIAIKPTQKPTTAKPTPPPKIHATPKTAWSNKTADKAQPEPTPKKSKTVQDSDSDGPPPLIQVKTSASNKTKPQGISRPSNNASLESELLQSPAMTALFEQFGGRVGDMPGNVVQHFDDDEEDEWESERFQEVDSDEMPSLETLKSEPLKGKAVANSKYGSQHQYGS